MISPITLVNMTRIIHNTALSIPRDFASRATLIIYTGQQVAHCIFCGTVLTKTTRSKEHVFAVWLLEELGFRNGPIRPSVVAPNGRDQVLVRDLTYDGFQAGRVCRVCNNGWMSQMEDDIKPILTGLIRGNISLKSLDRGALELVARWAAKTTYALSSTTQTFSVRIPAEHPASLALPPYTPAPEVSVFAFQCSTADANEADRPTWLASASTFRYEIEGKGAPEEEIRSLHHNSYKVCVGMDKLLLLTAAWPSPWVPVFWQEIHVPLWSRASTVYSQPKSNFPSNRKLGRLAFHTSLA
jgi:hypothetical protein